MRMLDLFCGRWGWSRAFAERGWSCVGVDLVAPPEVPSGCTFVQADAMHLSIGPVDLQVYCADGSGEVHCLGVFDFICASSPCEQFSVWGMPHFHPNPDNPQEGIRLFTHTRSFCGASGSPFVMENVRAAQQFVGDAVDHCGPFYLWGSAVPPILPQGVTKAKWTSNAKIGRVAPGNFAPELLLPRKRRAALLATIPPELAACVADYATRLAEVAA